MSPLNENREIIAVLAVCLILTGGNIWLHRDSPPANWTSTEQYGIKFRHPQGFRFSSSTPTSWIPGYWNGGIQGEPTSGEQEIIGIYWITDKAGTLERALEYIYELGKEDNPGLIIEPPEPMRVGEYEVLYSVVNLENGGINVPGVLAAFRDPHGRIIVPYYLRYPGTVDYAEKRIRQIINGIEITPPNKPRGLTTYWPTEEWRYAAPEEMGFDDSGLQDMLDDIESRPSTIQVDSVLVVKNGYIVLEKYYNGYNETASHIIYSCTKSVVSTIFGIAYEKGTIPSLDTKLLEIFPDYNPVNMDEGKESINLQDLLMMSAGFDARDSWLYEWEKLNDLHDAQDAVGYTLDLPMAFEPGSRFEYTNAVSHLLSCIITEKTGVSAREYGEEYLFDPLEITVDKWDTDNQGRNWGYNRIYITPKDMAKIGYLFLHEGEWDGEQIISSDWVEEATRHRIDANILEGYGYQWWVGEGFYAATGYMGQFIFVYPEHDLVIVFTGGTDMTYDYSLQLPERFIIPALN